MDVWKELKEVGHIPMRRAVTFAAGLALNQNAPHVAVEMISGVQQQNYVSVRNLKVCVMFIHLALVISRIKMYLHLVTVQKFHCALQCCNDGTYTQCRWLILSSHVSQKCVHFEVLCESEVFQ
jgi:hypothetical protein